MSHAHIASAIIARDPGPLSPSCIVPCAQMYSFRCPPLAQESPEQEREGSHGGSTLSIHCLANWCLARRFLMCAAFRLIYLALG